MQQNFSSSQSTVHSRGASQISHLQVESEQFQSPSVCQDCGAVYLEDGWHWLHGAHPAGSHTVRCVACARIHQKEPAGYVTIQGKFSREHCDELLSFIRNIEHRQKAEDPMQRIMSIDKRSEKLSIATTDTHLARSIGKALLQEYKGHLDFNYHKSECVLRVLWQR
jgi:hypothetical protein